MPCRFKWSVLPYLSSTLVFKTLYWHRGKNIRVNMHTTASKMTSQIKEGLHPNGIVKWNQAKINQSWIFCSWSAGIGISGKSLILFLSPRLQWAEHIWPLFQFTPSVRKIFLYSDCIVSSRGKRNTSVAFFCNLYL